MDTKLTLTVISRTKDTLTANFIYSGAAVSVDDTVSLFLEDSSDVLVSSKVGNPYGHWSNNNGSFKVGQVSLDISKLTLHENKRYFLYYISKETKVASCVLVLKNGVLVPIHRHPDTFDSLTKEESPTPQDYICISENASFDTSSFEDPLASPQPSSSFVVVPEGDSQPEQPEELFVTENSFEDSKSQSEKIPDSYNEENVQSILDHEPSSPCDDETSTEIVSNSFNEVSNSNSRLRQSDFPVEMSASVNCDDRVTTQKEVQLLKSNNKDLMTKMRKLTTIMERMQMQNSREDDSAKVQHLESVIEQFQQKINQFDRENAQLRGKLEIAAAQNQQLEQENIDLNKKHSQVVVEKNTLFERSATLLNELQDKEKENEVLKSENMVLQGKLKRLDDERRKRKKQGRDDHEGEHKTQKETVKPKPTERRSIKPTFQRKPLENGHDTEHTTSRPSNLPLTGGGRLKQVPPDPQQRKETHPPPADGQQKRHPAAVGTRATCTSQPIHDQQRASNTTHNLSEKRIDEIASSLRGTPTVTCPICHMVLHARENEYSVLLHVERCLQSTAM